MTRIVAVLGSVTPPGRMHVALSGALERARASGAEVELIDLSALRLDFADGRPSEQHDDDSARVIATVGAADAVLLATPVYRGTYTGALKNLLDLLPIEALQNKPVGIVAMGASQHHYLGADWHLRDVLAWFGALVAPNSVYLTSADFVDGKPTDDANAALDALFATLKMLAEATKGASFGPLPLAGRR
jgi:FMN reductase